MKSYDPTLFESLKTIAVSTKKELEKCSYSNSILERFSKNKSSFILSDEAIKKAISICEKLGATELSRLTNRFHPTTET
jgi:hypothetical protein